MVRQKNRKLNPITADGGYDPSAYPTKWEFGNLNHMPDKRSWDQWPLYPVLGTIAVVPAVAVHYELAWLEVDTWWVTVALYLLNILSMGPVIFAGIMFIFSRSTHPAKNSNLSEFFEFNDASFEASYGRSNSGRVPIETLYEAYFAGKVDLKGDLLETLYERTSYSRFAFTFNHLKFFLFQFLPEVLIHSQKQDVVQVRDHYDRGNDFYNAFLGATMVYTSGIWRDPEDTLEQAQAQKMDLVCKKVGMEPGDSHLDIGCGWGTLVAHAAKKYGTDSTGITLAKNQADYANRLMEEEGVEEYARALVCDYRDIPSETTWKRITCLEMAEHVGVKNFLTFLRQVYDLMDDDGLFFLQIAGLRRSWQFEDLQWGLFMNKYVFPGADASMPIGWVVSKAEEAGFEAQSLECIGVHYAATIKRWYDNWVTNKKFIIGEYGERWYRVWEWFLAWSAIIPEQGSASCWQLLFNKNTNAFDRKRFMTNTAKLYES